MTVYVVFQAWHKGENFITIFSEEKDAKEYVDLGNKKAAPFCGYFYNPVEIDELNNLIENGKLLFLVILDKNGNKLFSKKLKEIPCPIKVDFDVPPFMNKVHFDCNYSGKDYDDHKEDDWNIYYMTHQCNAVNEEDALSQALKAKEKFDKSGVWGLNQFSEKYDNDLIEEK